MGFASNGLAAGGIGSRIQSAGLGISVVIGIVLVILAIVLTVIWSLKYIRRGEDADSFLGKLFTFKYFTVGKILKVLYILSVTVITALSAWIIVALVVTGITSGSVGAAIGGIVGGIILGVISFILLQIVTRIAYEWLLLMVRQAEDVRVLRNMVAEMPSIKDSGVSFDENEGFIDSLQNDFRVDDISSSIKMPKKRRGKKAKAAGRDVGFAATYASAQSAPAQPAAGQPVPVQPVATQPSPAQASVPAEWNCACGRTGNKGAFCPGCGSRRP